MPTKWEVDELASSEGSTKLVSHVHEVPLGIEHLPPCAIVGGGRAPPQRAADQRVEENSAARSPCADHSRHRRGIWRAADHSTRPQHLHGARFARTAVAHTCTNACVGGATLTQSTRAPWSVELPQRRRFTGSAWLIPWWCACSKRCGSITRVGPSGRGSYVPAPPSAANAFLSAVLPESAFRLLQALFRGRGALSRGIAGASSADDRPNLYLPRNE